MSAIDLGREAVACRAMFRHAFNLRWNQGGNWLNWVLLGAGILIPLLTLGLKGRPSLALSIGMGAPVGVLVLLWWFMLLDSIRQQNGAQARLVPRIAMRSVTVLSFAWVSATFGLTLLYAIGGAPVAMTAAGISLVLIATALMLFVPFCLPALGLLSYGSSMLGVTFPFSFKVAFIELMIGANVVLGAVVLRAVSRNRRLTKQWLTKHWTVAEFKKLGSGKVSSKYAYRLRRDCAQRHPRTLLMHCIPHVGTLSLGTAVGMVGGMYLFNYIRPELVIKFRPQLLLFFPPLMVSLQILGTMTLIGAVYGARKEHAVARLAPGMPGAHHINGALGVSLLARFTRGWLGTSAVVLGTSWIVGVEPGRLWQLLAGCCITLPCAGMVLRDYSASNDARPWVHTMRLVLLAAAFVVMLSAAYGAVNLSFWAMLGAASVAYSAVFGAWRWHAMQRAPTALPAGRCA